MCFDQNFPGAPLGGSGFTLDWIYCASFVWGLTLKVHTRVFLNCHIIYSIKFVFQGSPSFKMWWAICTCSGYRQFLFQVCYRKIFLEQTYKNWHFPCFHLLVSAPREDVREKEPVIFESFGPLMGENIQRLFCDLWTFKKHIYQHFSLPERPGGN